MMKKIKVIGQMRCNKSCKRKQLMSESETMNASCLGVVPMLVIKLCNEPCQCYVCLSIEEVRADIIVRGDGLNSFFFPTA